MGTAVGLFLVPLMSFSTPSTIKCSNVSDAQIVEAVQTLNIRMVEPTNQSIENHRR